MLCTKGEKRTGIFFSFMDEVPYEQVRERFSSLVVKAAEAERTLGSFLAAIDATTSSPARRLHQNKCEALL